jgi:hypothetical protein
MVNGPSIREFPLNPSSVSNRVAAQVQLAICHRNAARTAQSRVDGALNACAAVVQVMDQINPAARQRRYVLALPAAPPISTASRFSCQIAQLAPSDR